MPPGSMPPGYRPPRWTRKGFGGCLGVGGAIIFAFIVVLVIALLVASL